MDRVAVATLVHRRQLVEQRGERTRCRALLPSLTPCSSEEHELLSTPPPEWAMRTLMFFPFPMKLKPGTDAFTPELGCLG